MLNILYEDNHLIVVEKPYNMPMNPDDSKDLDLLTAIKQYIKEKYHKPNNVYLGLVHRLDRPVGGVCVFAKTSKAAGRLSDQIRLRTFSKTYLAVVEDHHLKNQDQFQDYLLKNKAKNMVTVNPKGKLAKLSYEVINRNDKYAKVLIHLETGRPHQIRVQFASRNHPLYGDQRYNKNAKVGQQIALYANSISFNHPTTKERITFTSQPKNFIL